MDAGDAGRQAAHPDLRKACSGKHIGKHLGFWERANGFHQITIAVGIAGHHLTKPWQRIERPGIIGARQDGAVYL